LKPVYAGSNRDIGQACPVCQVGSAAAIPDATMIATLVTITLRASTDLMVG
jgi:hypothetical protein